MTEYDDITKEVIRINNNPISYPGARIKMFLVGKGVDPLEGENGYAPTTWVSENIIDGYNNTILYYGSSDTSFNWIDCYLRKFLQGQFTTKIFPQDLLQYVRRVIKYSSIRELAGSNTTNKAYPSIEWFWIPSSREIFGTCTNLPTNASYIGDLSLVLETMGPAYDWFGERVEGVSDYEETKENRITYKWDDTTSRVNTNTRSNLPTRIFGNNRALANLNANGYAEGGSSPGGNQRLGFCL